MTKKPATTDDLDAAIEAIEKSTVARTTIKKREYPVPPQGAHTATCKSAELQDASFQDSKPGDVVIKLRWETEKTYEDKSGEEHPYSLFSKSYALYFSEKSSLAKLCNSLTGKPPVYTEVGKDDDGDPIVEFDAGMFVDMQCDLVVEHVEHKGKTYANIAAYLANDKQKKHNCTLLPS